MIGVRNSRSNGRNGEGAPHQAFLLTCFRLFSLILLAFILPEAAQSANFEHFKQQISTPAMSYRVEFIEGNVWESPSNSVERMGGRLVVRQSQRRYTATYQSDGFLLKQEPEVISLNELHTNVSLFVDCGRSGTQGWVRRDSAFVRLADLEIATTNPTVQAVVDEVNRAESKTLSACFFGLPEINKATLKWMGVEFTGKTTDGSLIAGKVRIELATGLVAGAAYHCEGQTEESATIAYSYSGNKDASSLPDVIEKFVSQAATPIRAAQNSFKIKITKREERPQSFAPEAFMPPLKQLYYLISNGIPLTRMGERFVAAEVLAGTLGPARHSSQTDRSSSRLVVLVLLVASGLALGFFVRSMTKTKMYNKYIQSRLTNCFKSHDK